MVSGDVKNFLSKDFPKVSRSDSSFKVAETELTIFHRENCVRKLERLYILQNYQTR